jgi:hypothetical protein
MASTTSGPSGTTTVASFSDGASSGVRSTRPLSAPRVLSRYRWRSSKAKSTTSSAMSHTFTQRARPASTSDNLAT